MISCLITDDEPIALDILEEYLEMIPHLQLAGRCQGAMEAFEVMQQQPVDLLFLDIKMPGLNGLDFLRSLRQPPLVILTTAYAEHALAGYELDVVDYLLKPIPLERFVQAVDKVQERLNARDPKRFQPKDHLFLKVEHRLVKVRYDEILYIKGLKDYVKVICKDRRVLSLISMKKLLEQLPAEFIRVHRSYILSLDRIDEIESHAFKVAGKSIPIGVSYRAQVRLALEGMRKD